MNAGLGRLGLAPSVFWGMTLQELDAALNGAMRAKTPDAPDLRELTSLMSRFPDAEGDV